MAKLFPQHYVVVDMVVFHWSWRLSTQVLLIKRGGPPFKGRWALPGGFVDFGETTKSAAVRELKEETGVDARSEDVSLVGVYDEPGRDPRGPNISVAYWTSFLGGNLPVVQGSDDAAEARWFPLAELPELAFDHKDIIAAAAALYT